MAADVATVTTPLRPERRFRIRPGMGWPLGLLVAAIVYFVYAYLDKYFRGSIPSGTC